MGVKIFRDDNRKRVKNRAVSRKDIMNLDKEKDRELIGYLIAHASGPCHSSMIKYVTEKYGMDELPAPLINIDDLEDIFFWEYAVLHEQVLREEDRDALIAAALHGLDRSVSAFAFCRLTGYSFPVNECDVYSYRTFDCGIMPGMTEDDIREFCEMVIEEEGPLKDVAKEYLCD